MKAMGHEKHINATIKKMNWVMSDYDGYDRTFTWHKEKDINST